MRHVLAFLKKAEKGDFVFWWSMEKRKTTIVFIFYALRRGVPCFFCRCIFHGENCETKSPFFGFFQKSQNMSHGNGSSAFVFQVMGIIKPVMVSTDKGLQLFHSQMVGCHLLSWRNLQKKIAFFRLFSKKPKHVSWKWL